MITEWMEPGSDRVEITVMQDIGDGERRRPASTVDDPDDDLDAEPSMDETELDLVGWFG